MSLESGEVHRLSATQVAKIQPISVLIGNIPPHLWGDAEGLIAHIHAPLRGLSNELLLFQALASLVGAVWFSVNFILLNFYLAAGGVGAPAVFLSLIASIVISAWLIVYAVSRGRAQYDALIDARIAMLWFDLVHRPHGPPTGMSVNLLSSRLKTAFQLKSVATSLSIAMLPMVFFAALRLPAIMFAALMLVILGMSIWQWRRTRHRPALESAFDASQYQAMYELASLLVGLDKLRFMGAIPAYLARWRARLIAASKAELVLKQHEVQSNVLTDLTGNLVLVIALLSLVVLQGFANLSGEPDIPIGIAYSLVYLTTNLGRALPSAALAFGELRQNQIALRSIENSSLVASPIIRIETNRPSVTLTAVELPYGCRFDGGMNSITLEQGSFLHLQGESGSGKTTLLRAIQGMITPISGQVRVMGVPPAQMVDADRSAVFSVLDGDPIRGARSIRDTLGLFHSSAPSDDSILWQQLADALLEQRIRALKLGLDTPLLDANTFLSTGEQQRLMLAQLFGKSGRVFIADEAFSGLPKAVELHLFEIIRTKYPIIIAASHRMHFDSLATHHITMQPRGA
jgi:ABC-type bacteriocin/lantibiotic exporter with double-glycine peptidase domain